MARPVPSARPGWGRRVRARRRAALIGSLLALELMALSGPPGAAAFGNDLYEASVTPHLGTTDTSFQFTVKFTSFPNRRALSVEAHVAGLTVALALISGTETDGKWRGFSQVPEGDDWSVTFVADAESGSDPTTSGPSLDVTAAPPTPTPLPTPTPSPTPTATPSGTPPGSPAPSPSAAGSASSPPSASAAPTAIAPTTAVPASTFTPTDSATPAETPGPSASLIWGAFGGGAVEQPTASQAEAAAQDGPPSRRPTTGGIDALPIISGGLVTFGLLGLAGVLAVQRDRRRRWVHDRLARAVGNEKPERPPRRWVMRP